MNPYLKAWLRFNDPQNITKDECGNEWITDGNLTISDNALVFPGDATQNFFLNGGITLGGQSFTIRTRAKWDSSCRNYFAFFYLCSTQTGYWINLYKIKNNTSPTAFYARTVLHYHQCDISPDTEHDIEWSYNSNTDKHYIFVDGVIATTATEVLPETFFDKVYLGIGSNGTPLIGTMSDFMILDGIALHTNNNSFEPPTEDYFLGGEDLPYNVSMYVTRSVVKPTDNYTDIRRTVESTLENFANSSSRVIRSEDTFANVARAVNKTADEFANAKRAVRVSADNNIAPIRRTVNVADNFASVKRSNICSEQNFSPIKRSVLSSQECELQTQRRLLNLADELASLQRSVHEPQVVDIYTRRRLINNIETLANTRRQAQLTADNFADSHRQVLCSDDSFSPTKRTVDKTLDTFSNTKRQISFSADNEFEPICYVLNDSDNIAHVESHVIRSDIYFVPTVRETTCPEVIFADTLRQITIQSIFVSVKTQGGVIDTIVFHQSKQSSIGHLCTRFRGITFYAGLVNLSSALASNIHIAKNGTIYAVMKE